MFTPQKEQMGNLRGLVVLSLRGSSLRVTELARDSPHEILAMPAPEPDAKPDIDDLLDSVTEAVRNALLVAYARGEQSARRAAKEAIMRAVGGPDDDEGRIVAVVEPRRHYGGGRSAPIKAPRGLVAKAIRDVLTDQPGLPITEIEALVTDRFPIISPKSVGNELRRQEGVEYRREGKYSWFVMSEPQKESARPTGGLADLLRSQRKGGEGS